MTLTVEKFSWGAAARQTLSKEDGARPPTREPVASGLLVAPSAAGAALALAAGSGFFLRRPLKLLLSRKSDPRQPLAAMGMAILLLTGLVGLLLAVRFGAPGGWWPRSEERRVGKECRSRWSPRQ